MLAGKLKPVATVSIPNPGNSSQLAEAASFILFTSVIEYYHSAGSIQTRIIDDVDGRVIAWINRYWQNLRTKRDSAT